MKTCPTPPAAGTPVSASFFARLVGWVRSCTLVDGPGYRVRRGPNGTSLELAPAKVRSASGACPPGRFTITLTEEQPGENAQSDEKKYTAKFTNLYYDIGGKTYEMPRDNGGTDEKPSVHIGGVKDGDIIVLKVGATDNHEEELVTVESIGELQDLQEDDGFYCLPLYSIDGGTVACDFRCGPSMTMGEF